MMFPAFISLSVVLVILEVSTGQRSLIGQTGHKIRVASKDSSVNVAHEPSKDNSDCDSKKEITEDVAISFKTLNIFGDRELLLSENDEHHKEHCEHSIKHFNTFERHAKCLDARKRELVDLIANGFRKSILKRCVSKTWHKEYVKFSKCMVNLEKQEALHACQDKIYTTLNWILKNIPEADQINVVCCIANSAFNCIHDETLHFCGQQIANFTSDTLFDPWIDYLDRTCGRFFEERCVGSYPEALEKLEEIFSSKQPKRDRGYWNLLLKIMQNQIDSSTV